MGERSVDRVGEGRVNQAMQEEANQAMQEGGYLPTWYMYHPTHLGVYALLYHPGYTHHAAPLLPVPVPLYTAGSSAPVTPVGLRKVVNYG